MRWDNVAIQWSDFACENSNQLGKRFRRRTGKRYSGFKGQELANTIVIAYFQFNRMMIQIVVQHLM